MDRAQSPGLGVQLAVTLASDAGVGTTPAAACSVRCGWLTHTVSSSFADVFTYGWPSRADANVS
jgi:hypothetical protein